MIRQLEEAGTAVQREPETYPNGLLASLVDPEENSVQLWEPTGAGT